MRKTFWMPLIPPVVGQVGVLALFVVSMVSFAGCGSPGEPGPGPGTGGGSSTGTGGGPSGTGGSGGGGGQWTGAAKIEFRKGGIAIVETVLTKQITAALDVAILDSQNNVLNISKLGASLESMQPSMLDAVLDSSGSSTGLAQLTSKADIFDMGSEPKTKVVVKTKEVSAELMTTSVIKTAGSWKVNVAYTTGGGSSFVLNIEQDARSLSGERCVSGSSCVGSYTGKVQDKQFSFNGNPTMSGITMNGTFTDLTSISGKYNGPTGSMLVGDFVAKRM